MVDKLLAAGSLEGVVRLATTCKACKAACARVLEDLSSARRASGHLVHHASVPSDWGSKHLAPALVLVFDEPLEVIRLLKQPHINISHFAAAARVLLDACQQSGVEVLAVALPELPGCQLPYRAIILACARKHSCAALQRAGLTAQQAESSACQHLYCKGLQLQGVPQLCTLMPSLLCVPSLTRACGLRATHCVRQAWPSSPCDGSARLGVGGGEQQQRLTNGHVQQSLPWRPIFWTAASFQSLSPSVSLRQNPVSLIRLNIRLQATRWLKDLQHHFCSVVSVITQYCKAGALLPGWLWGTLSADGKHNGRGQHCHTIVSHENLHTCA